MYKIYIQILIIIICIYFLYVIYNGNTTNNTINNNILNNYSLFAVIIIAAFIVYNLCLLFDDYKNYRIDYYKNLCIKLLESNDVKLIDAKNRQSMKNRRNWDIIVYDFDKFWNYVSNGTLGIGEAYVAKYWDCVSLDVLFTKIINLQNNIFPFDKTNDHNKNLQTREKSFEVQNIHYNIDYNFYVQMLGTSMAYSCGYWKNVKSLDDAQNAKFKLICDKLEIKPTDHVLDIGCGYGSLMLYMVQNYGCKCTGVNISKEQLLYARKTCKNYPIHFLECDYRDIPEYKFDKIVSVGFCEHVGYKNYEEFINVAHSRLKDDGLFLLHTIGGNISTKSGDAWLDKYIFPNGMLPSIAQLGRAIENKFVMEDWHNFGPDYDKTLMAWYENYLVGKNSGTINVSDKFDRIWKYYLLSCAGCFRSRHCQLWQIILSKSRKTAYRSIR